jgi:hypothetical protein
LPLHPPIQAHLYLVVSRKLAANPQVVSID